MPESTREVIVLYDGVCGHCSRAVRFLLKRDRYDRLRFASLQNDFARQLLQRHGLDSTNINTVYAVINHGQAGEQLLIKGDAVLFIGGRLGGAWNLVRAGKIIPRSIRNRLYDFVARHRYQLSGKAEVCVLPDPGYQHKFVAG
jgi:predicted DCC family thiol-disulfide oxidoreductase YuxK